MDRLRVLLSERLERLQDLLTGLSPRDRALLLGMIGAGLVAVLIGGAWGLSSSLRSQKDRLLERQTQLTQVQALTAEHAAAQAKIEEIEQKIREHADTDLQAFLEKAGRNAGISDRINAVREKSSTVQGNLEDKLYSVSLSKLTLSEYSSFLYEMESAGYPLKVRTTKVKRRVKGEEVTLDVDMDISSFIITDDSGSQEG